jgi:phosphate transport system substrate-binding protein
MQMAKLIGASLGAGCLALAASVTPALAANITVKGSDTMVILAQRLAETYMKAHADVTIQVTGGGSGTGIAALINGTTNFANASRQIKAEEIAKAKAGGSNPQEYKVALDGLAVVVSADNPVKTLSMQQLNGIYRGDINNWSELGGKDAKIIRYCRESNSGTYVFFKEHVMADGDYAADCQTMPGTSAVAEAVSRDKNGIGYGGVAYFAPIKVLHIVSVKKNDASPAVSPLKDDGTPDYEAVWSGDYPIARGLYVYTANVPAGDEKAYLDWILGPQGQRVVAAVEYIPLKGGLDTKASAKP